MDGWFIFLSPFFNQPFYARVPAEAFWAPVNALRPQETNPESDDPISRHLYCTFNIVWQYEFTLQPSIRCRELQTATCQHFQSLFLKTCDVSVHVWSGSECSVDSRQCRWSYIWKTGRERDRQECDTAVRCVSVDAVYHLMHTVLNLLCEWCLFPKAREYSDHFQLF